MLNCEQRQTNGGTKMLDHQAEMWAILCEPPEQFSDLLQYFNTVEFKKKFNRTSFTWNTIDSDEVIRKFKIACVEYAVASARKVQPIPLPDYWQPIEDSCRQVVNALNDIGDLTAAYAAADAAADAAATAAYAAAADAAYTAATDAAYTAADAAYAAILAARATATYAAAARAAARAGAYAAIHAASADADDAKAVDDARAAAHADLFEIFINIILSEYENKG